MSLAPNDGSVDAGTRKIQLTSAAPTSSPFRISDLSALSGVKQTENRIALQVRRDTPGTPMPSVTLQARIPTVGSWMPWEHEVISIGGLLGNFWQGVTNFSLEYRLVMQTEDAADVTVLLQAG